jgi:hypothetical protein
MSMNPVTNGSPSELVRQKLSQYLGPFTAKNAVNIGAKQIGGASAESLTLAQVPALVEALGPTLRTLLGKTTADKVAEEIRKEFGL